MDDKIIRSDAKYRKKPSDPSFHFPPLGNPQRPRRLIQKHGEAKNLGGREEKQKEDNDVKKLHDVRELESEKDREEEKRWVGRGNTRAHQLYRRAAKCTTRDLNEKRDKQAQTN